MNSIRARLLVALTLLILLISGVAASLTYRRVLNETSELFDYQMRQMALTLRSQMSLAPRIEIPRDQGDVDFVFQFWDVFGTRTYLSRPGLPIINQTVLGYADLTLQGAQWRTFGLQTADGVIQIAQPAAVRARLAQRAALRVILPLILVLPALLLAVVWIVGRGLRPLRRLTADVKKRDARSLEPLDHRALPGEIAPLADELNRLLARLREAFTAQRAFVGDAAHELRSPLTAVRLQLQLLDRAPDDAARNEARTRLGEAIDREIHLVEQLLALARNEPLEAAGRWADVDLAAVAAAGVAECRTLAGARRIELSLDAEAAVRLQGDADALQVLVRNLVDNAVRYTPEGGRVMVQCRREPKSVLQSGRDGAVLLEVTDSGPGIALAERERVFDRFYRSPDATAIGSGLGLAIVRAIAQRHAAAVELADPPGGGLTVRVYFRGAS